MKHLTKMKSWIISLFAVMVLCNNAVQVEASSLDDNLLYFDEPHINYRNQEMQTVYFNIFNSYDSESDYFRFSSNAFDNIYTIGLLGSDIFTDILYLPDVYDYYLVVTMYSECSVQNFSFAPDDIAISFRNCDVQTYYGLENKNYYHHDKRDAYTGFTVTGKIPEVDSTSPYYIDLYDHDLGTVPDTDMYVRIQCLAVEKGDELSDLTIANELKVISNNQSILNQLQQENNTIQQQEINQNAQQHEEQIAQSSEQHEELVNGFDTTIGNNYNQELSDNLDQVENVESALTTDAFDGMNNYTITNDIMGYDAQFATAFPIVASMIQSVFDSSGEFGIILSVTFTVIIASMLIGLYRYYKE